MTDTLLSLRGRKGGLMRALRHDNAAQGRLGQQGLWARWTAQVEAEFPDLDAAAKHAKVLLLRRLYFTELGIKSAEAKRRRRKTPDYLC